MVDAASQQDERAEKSVIEKDGAEIVEEQVRCSGMIIYVIVYNFVQRKNLRRATTGFTHSANAVVHPGPEPGLQITLYSV